jgi:PKD repeat protein
VAASPDVISQDGQSQSILTILARDANGQPRRGVSLRLAMYVGGTNVDYGTLMNKIISTDNAGMASTIYTAPLAPPPTVSSDAVVDIQVLPVGNDYANLEPRYVTIRLARPGVILPPNPNVSASFFYSPTQPREDEAVIFDGSGSTGVLVSYAWTFGDGTTGTGVRPSHVYSVAGNYAVSLTVTDDRGTQATAPPQTVSVLGAPDPIAVFTISPIDPLVGDDVHFDGSSSTTPVGSGRTITSYEWNFGDGQFGAGKTATHKYGKAGTYTIVLNVKDSSGRRGTSSRTVQVK